MVSFWLNFGSQWFEIRPNDYVMSAGASLCFICLRAKENSNNWYLGATFMRDWYVIHDYDDQTPRVGFKRMPNSYLPEPVDPIDWPDNSNTNAPNTPS